jgi:hypothetical protein
MITPTVTKFDIGNDFLNVYLENKKHVIVTLVTKDFVTMTHNWYLSLKNVNLHDQALVVALDEECYQKMQEYNIPSVCLKTNINYLNINDIDTVTQRLHALAHIAKTFEIDIIYSDVDIVFLKNPLEELKNEVVNYDWAMISNRQFINDVNDSRSFISFKETFGFDISNGGFYGFGYGPYNNEKVRLWWDIFSFDFSKFKNYSATIQEIEAVDNSLIKDILYSTYQKYQTIPELVENQVCPALIFIKESLKKTDVKVKALNKKYFVNGGVLSTDLLLTKQKILDDAYIVHYHQAATDDEASQINQITFENINLENVKNNKIKIMQQNNHWYVD